MGIVQQGEFHDTRMLLFRLRRFDLWKICDYYRISYDNSTDTAPSLVRRIMDSGINADQHIKKVKINGVDQYVVDLPAPDKGTKPEVKTVEQSIGLQRGPDEHLKIPEEWRKEKGVEFEKTVKETETKVAKPKKVYATYEEMKVFSLRSLCKERGIPWTMTEKKDSLIEKLNQYNNQKVLSGQNSEALKNG